MLPFCRRAMHGGGVPACHGRGAPAPWHRIHADALAPLCLLVRRRRQVAVLPAACNPERARRRDRHLAAGFTHPGPGARAVVQGGAGARSPFDAGSGANASAVTVLDVQTRSARRGAAALGTARRGPDTAHRRAAPTSQVFHLREAGIACGYLSGSASPDEQRETLDALRASPPQLRIVFATPEKIACSDSLMRLLDALHARGLLVRSRVLATLPG